MNNSFSGEEDSDNEFGIEDIKNPPSVKEILSMKEILSQIAINGRHYNSLLYF